MEIPMTPQERIAKALFEDWQASDRELTLTWETAGDTLRRVFLRKAEVALEALSLPLEHLAMFVLTAEAMGISTEDKSIADHMEEYMKKQGLTL